MSEDNKWTINLDKNYYKKFQPLMLQSSVISISDDFTLNDAFILTDHIRTTIPGIHNALFIPTLDKFLHQIKLKKTDTYNPEITHLELYWHNDYDVRVTEKSGKDTDQKSMNLPGIQDANYWDNPYKSEISNIMAFHGISMRDDKISQGYAVEFIPVNNLAHLPILVSPEVTFYPPYVENNRSFSKSDFSLTIHPTLWCLLSSIFWELTFTGFDPSLVEGSLDKLIGDI